MDVNDLVRQVTTPSVTDIAIRVGLGLVVLVVGWLLSLFFAWLTRKLLGGLKVDQRMAKQTDSDKPQISVEDIGGKIVYYLGLLITVVAVFYVLNLLVVAT